VDSTLRYQVASTVLHAVISVLSFHLMDQANILIIGGGVIGCAIAREVSQRWQDVFLVEQFPRVGMATSTRNSGVIHSGIYYPKGSLKATHCVEGNRLSYEFCAKHNVPYRRTGKLVVAANQHEEPELEALLQRGRDNGVAGLTLVGRKEIQAREPHIHGTAALDVPSTGILSAEDLVRTHARLATDNGANIVTRAKVVALTPTPGAVRVDLEIGDEDGAQKESIEARCVVNAAGLFADEVAAMLGNRSWRIYPVRGEYCEIRGARSNLINSLVYPLPHHDGLSLGVHFTKTLWGTVLLGPTATYVEGKDNYERGRIAPREFAESAKTLLPEVEESDLQLGYSGLRPKLVPPTEKGIADFVITRDPAVPQAIHLVGMESPGLTAASSVAEHVSRLVAETFD
jgi:L-2-hydroxyglutarate oxidase LhgO